MTNDEFAGWREKTAQSAQNWQRDQIHDGQSGSDLLLYAGGESGVYIQVLPDAVVQVGVYANAIPHIGEAAFFVQGYKQAADREQAIALAMSLIGLRAGALVVGVGARR